MILSLRRIFGQEHNILNIWLKLRLIRMQPRILIMSRVESYLAEIDLLLSKVVAETSIKFSFQDSKSVTDFLLTYQRFKQFVKKQEAKERELVE